MKTQLLCLRVWPILLALYGCNAEWQPLAIENHSQYPTAFAEEIIAGIEQEIGGPLGLERWTLVMRENPGDGCPPDAVACTYIGMKTAFVPFTSVYSDANIAGVVCHELVGHAWQYEYLGNEDTEHKSLWIFSQLPEEGLCGRVRQLFK